jgi:hypothetical protein
MMEYWNAGMLGIKSGKRPILHKMMKLHILYDTHQASLFCFLPKILHQNKKINE